MTQPQLRLTSAVAVMLRAAGGGYVLGLVGETATEVEQFILRAKGPLVVTAVQAARVVGPTGVGVVLCCAGLALALLSATLGVSLGTGVTVRMAEAGWSSHITPGLMGVVIALGAVGGGAGLGAAIGGVPWTHYMGILCPLVFGTDIGIYLTLVLRSQASDGLKQVNVFLALVFVTMFVGVILGFFEADIIADKHAMVLAPVFGLVVAGIILVPAGTRLGTVAEQVVGRLTGHSQYIGIFLGRLFGNLVALSGFLLGAVAGPSWQTAQVQPLVMTLLHSLVPVMLFLAGTVGAALGTVTLGLADGARAVSVSVWVSTATWVLLKTFSTVVVQWSMLMGTGSMVGALLGAYGAAGLSIGAVGVTSGAQFGAKGIALAILGSTVGAVLASTRKTLRTAAVILLAAFAPRIAGMEAVVRIHSEASGKVKSIGGTLKGAIIWSMALGSTALGSAILGVIVLRAAAFGTAAHSAVLVVTAVILRKNLR
ncbi:hypothetical protein GJAV_G00019170 [Gymnothorax javanicus]|nr:hypothetical protein GJAV_G00019170 [Gymnothorax javanicus]